MEKEIKRGYVKWTDSDGVFHKELLSDHPELLAAATPKQQLQAEEARRMNEAAEAKEEIDEQDDAQDTLEALREAPEDVLTAAQLVTELDEVEHDEHIQEPKFESNSQTLPEFKE